MGNTFNKGCGWNAVDHDSVATISAMMRNARRISVSAGKGVELLNIPLKVLWPSICEQVKTTMFTSAEPLLQESLGGSFYFEREGCHFGDGIINLIDAKVTNAKQYVEGVILSNLTISGHVEWFTENVNLNVYLQQVKVGIKSIFLTGVLVCEFVGLNHKPPFCNGVRIYFNERPHLDLKFKGDFESVLNHTTARRLLRDCALESICSIVVVPNWVAFTVSQDDGDSFFVLHPEPLGQLTLTILRASGLKPSDGDGLSDPYVLVRSGAVVHKSEIQKATLSPVFLFEVKLLIYDENLAKIQIVVMDSDLLKHDDFLGKVDFEAKSTILSALGQEMTIDLSDEYGIPGASGKVFLTTKYNKTRLYNVKETSLEGIEGHLFSVGLHSIQHLQRKKVACDYWVTAYLDNKPQVVQKTARIRVDGLNPNEELWAKRYAKCKQHKLRLSDMAGILGVDMEVIQRFEQHEDIDLMLSEVQHLNFEHMFDFSFRDIDEVVAVFELWGQDVRAISSMKSDSFLTRAAPSVLIGSCSFSAASCLAKGSEHIATLDASDVSLRFHMRLRSFGGRQHLFDL